MRDLLYISEASSSEGNFFTICGLSFSEFIKGVERPLNLLVLHSLFPDPTSFQEISFDAIRDNLEDQRFNDLDKLLDNPKYLDGDFCWVDYCDEQRLLAIEDEELAELCFLARQNRPLNSPFFPSLDNRFVYFGHDDGFHTSLHVRDRRDYGRILLSAIQQKAVHHGFNFDDTGDILNLLKDGLVIDFTRISTSGLPVYSYEGQFSFDSFDRHELHSSMVAVKLVAEQGSAHQSTTAP